MNSFKKFLLTLVAASALAAVAPSAAQAHYQCSHRGWHVSGDGSGNIERFYRHYNTTSGHTHEVQHESPRGHRWISKYVCNYA